MFKVGLLITTALIVATSVCYAGTQPQAPAGDHMQNAILRHDTNNEFMHTYGGTFVVSLISNVKDSSSYSIRSQDVAIPIVGSGRSVNRIAVKEARFLSSSEFEVGIYSNNPSGFPGKLLSYGIGKTGAQSEWINVQVSPVTLKRKKPYWIVQSILDSSGGASHIVLWAADNKTTKRKAYVQDYTYYYHSNSHSHSSGSYTSPWQPQSTGAKFKLGGVKGSTQ